MDTLPICVSIIVPVYNGERYLAVCLDSLIRQTLYAIEIIVIDDCSTDKTPDILHNYAIKDQRIRVIRNEKNMRQGLSRNKALVLARGEYVGFVDSDDWVDATFYERLYDAAKYEQASIAKANMILVDANGAIVQGSFLNKLIATGLKRGEPLPVLFSYEFTTAIYLRSTLIAHEISFPDIRNGEDLVFLFRATMVSSQFVMVKNVYYHYRQHTDSTEAVRTKDYYESIIQAAHNMLFYASKHAYSNAEKDLVAAHAVRLLIAPIKELEGRSDLNNFFRTYQNKCIEMLMLDIFSVFIIFEKIPEGFDILKTSEKYKNSYSFKIGSIIINKIILKIINNINVFNLRQNA